MQSKFSSCTNSILCEVHGRGHRKKDMDRAMVIKSWKLWKVFDEKISFGFILTVTVKGTHAIMYPCNKLHTEQYLGHYLWSNIIRDQWNILIKIKGIFPILSLWLALISLKCTNKMGQRTIISQSILIEHCTFTLQ